MSKLACFVALLCAACGTSVQPSDGSASTDAVVTDASSIADVEIVEPTSLVRVVRIPASPTLGERTEVLAWLLLPEREAPGGVDRDMGECFYRRRPPLQATRFHTDGMATWGYRSVRRSLALPSPTWPLADGITEAHPNTGDVVNVALQGSSFPDFSLSAPMPSELTVTSHSSGTTISYPTRGESLTVEWAVPSAPASVRIGINFNDTQELHCIVPATRGRFMMEEPLLEMFRDATTAQLVVGHVQVQRVVVGNRSLRYIVERRGILATFER
jgi:hypothetical protein